MRPSARRDPITFEGKPGHWSYSILFRRTPKKGDYYLSGAVVQAWLAPNDIPVDGVRNEYLIVIPLRRFVMRSEWQLASRPRKEILG